MRDAKLKKLQRRLNKVTRIWNEVVISLEQHTWTVDGKDYEYYVRQIERHEGVKHYVFDMGVYSKTVVGEEMKATSKGLVKVPKYEVKQEDCFVLFVPKEDVSMASVANEFTRKVPGQYFIKNLQV
jgi:hypothetical protein